MSPELLYRAVVLLLWALVALNSWVCRGLFWDGASFLAIVLDTRTFHDFYPARAHVAWVTQAPVLLLIKAGVSDTRVLSIVYSATLFALPTALYQFALRRVRSDAVLLGAILAILAVVYLPTWFFIIGEYHTTYAAATAAMAILLTGPGFGRRDGALLCGLGALCLASYEAMIYLGPFLAAATLWSMARGRVAWRAPWLFWLARWSPSAPSSNTGITPTSPASASRPSISGRTCSSSCRWRDSPSWRSRPSSHRRG